MVSEEVKGRLEKELDKAYENNQVVLLITDSKNYHEVNSKVLEFLVEKKDSLGIYTTINRPYSDLKRALDKYLDVGQIFFIDAISRETGCDVVDTKDALFLETPRDLTDISIAISELVDMMPEEKKFLFIDSLSALVLYNHKKAVTDFTHHLTGKMRSWNMAGVIISLKEEVDEEMTSYLTQFCDRTVEILEK